MIPDMRFSILFALILYLTLMLGPVQADEPKTPAVKPAVQARPIPGRGPIRLPGRGPVGQPAKPEPIKWGEKQIVLTATITDIKQGPTARSFPPIYNHTLTLKVDQVLRGSLKPGTVLKANHSARQQAKPNFPEGKVVVALSNVRGGNRVEGLELADAKKLATIQLACELPLGWRQENGKTLSPWAKQKDRAWPKGAKAGAKHFCTTTGRPALLVNSNAIFHAAKVEPKKAIKWTNPDGDGEYKITVSNPTDQPLTVDALRREGKRVLWKESLVILCQGQAYTAPGSVGLLRPTQPVVLKPGETISTVINALELQGPNWPRGGYRIEFQFCLGQRSSKQSFYYMARHHDVIRASLRKPVN